MILGLGVLGCVVGLIWNKLKNRVTIKLEMKIDPPEKQMEKDNN